MGTEIRLWQVTKDKLTKLSEVSFSNTHKEKDLEEWVESDPSILGRELTVIGRQIYIPKVGPLDLLAVDQSGKLVIVEFKRHQTTRDSIAQILDYASSIRTMDVEQLVSIANVDVSELREVTDFDPALILVAAEADESAERIVDYLASKAQLSIEVVTFTFATLADGQEIIARSILVPEASSVTQPAILHIPLPEILRVAAERRVEAQVEVIRKVRDLGWGEEPLPRHGGTLRYWLISQDNKEKVLFSMDIGGQKLSSPEGAIDLWFNPQTAADYSGLSAETTWDQLEKFTVEKRTNTKIFIRLTDLQEAKRLYELLTTWKTLGDETRIKEETIRAVPQD